MSMIATHAKSLIAQVQAVSMIKHFELDTLSKPLIECLVAEGKITQVEANDAFVEAQGIWEFGCIPIRLGGSADGSQVVAWVQVYGDGTVERGPETMNDCNVLSRDLLDDERRAEFAPWLVEMPSGAILEFNTEEQACAYQRQHRIANGLNPMNGEPA